MDFNFDGSPSQSKVVTPLTGNAIHTVKFAGIEAKEIESKATGEIFKILSIKFKNDDGVFEDTVFEPKPGDDKRKQNQFGYDSPAPLEELMFKLKHLLAAVAPVVAEKIEKAGGFKVENWDALRNFMVAQTKNAVDKVETQIKLISRTDAKGVTRANFPSFVLGINKEGKSYPRTNFIGTKLAFTAKEQEKINNATVAKPSNMDPLITPEVPSLKASDLDGLDFDNV